MYKNVRLDLPDETNAEKIFTLECGEKKSFVKNTQNGHFDF